MSVLLVIILGHTLKHSIKNIPKSSDEDDIYQRPKLEQQKEFPGMFSECSANLLRIVSCWSQDVHRMQKKMRKNCSRFSFTWLMQFLRMHKPYIDWIWMISIFITWWAFAFLCSFCKNRVTPPTFFLNSVACLTYILCMFRPLRGF